MDPRDFDVSLIDRLVNVFAFHESEAARLILKWSWDHGTLDVWDEHLRVLSQNAEIRNPRAFAAALMRKQALPEKERPPADSKFSLVKEILERHRGKLFRGKHGDYWKICPQGIMQIEDGRLLSWSALTIEDLRRIDRDAMGLRPDDTNSVGYTEWLQSDDCGRYLEERKQAGIDVARVERLREKALAGGAVHPGESLA